MTPIHILLEELLRLRKAGKSDTTNFRSLNHDEICRKVEDQINHLGDSYLKYENIAYMVQGPRDQGVDVLLKSTVNNDTEKYTGIQVKSYTEIDNKSNDLSKSLKAGYHDARNHYGERLERYYILLCGDSGKHSKRISSIINEFSKEPNVRMIEPRYSYNFITQPPQVASAVSEAFLRGEDYIRSKARKEIIEYSDAELHFILCCLCHTLSDNEKNLDDDSIYEYLDWENPDKKSNIQPEQVWENLSGSVFEIYARNDSTRFLIELFPALRVLYYDLSLRYGWSDTEMVEHLYTSFRVST